VTIINNTYQNKNIVIQRKCLYQFANAKTLCASICIIGFCLVLSNVNNSYFLSVYFTILLFLSFVESEFRVWQKHLVV